MHNTEVMHRYNFKSWKLLSLD